MGGGAAAEGEEFGVAGGGAESGGAGGVIGEERGAEGEEEGGEVGGVEEGLDTVGEGSAWFVSGFFFCHLVFHVLCPCRAIKVMR